MVDGVASSIATGQKTFDWSNGVKLEICMTNDELHGSVNGTEVVSIKDTTFGDGRVGLYDRLLIDANFDYLTTSNDSTFTPSSDRFTELYFPRAPVRRAELRLWRAGSN